MKRIIFAYSGLLLFWALPATVQAQFTYTTNADNTLTITGYTGSGGTVSIPTNINGLTVSGIGTNAFAGTGLNPNIKLNSVTIPGSVSNIGFEAFYYCSQMTNATIGNGVTGIGNYAFAYTALASITVPGSVAHLGDYAFEDCRATNVTIMNGVSSLGQYSFYNCISLLSVTIASSVTDIEDYAFYVCTKLTNAVFPIGTSNIGPFAFSSTALRNVNIPPT